MQETWRWFGPKDTVTLENIIQAGATGVVSSLHDVSTGVAWPLDAVLAHQELITNAGLNWSVVESIPLHNDIKTHSGDYLRHIENYKTSLRHVGQAGIKVVCYNFMPVVDWTRTNLSYQLSNQSQALRFEMQDFAAYDLFMLERPNAHDDYSQEVIKGAEKSFMAMSDEQKALLEKNIIAGLPGGEGSYTRTSIRQAIAEFIALGVEGFRQNLFEFLKEVIPVAQAAGVKMCIHPDDPPFSLFGLPRVVSTAQDVRALLEAVPSEANGLTMCAGSFGASANNNLVDMAREFASHIHFVHLRNVKREADGSFYEAEHLNGDNDMVGLVQVFLAEEKRRKQQGRTDINIPMRPDHGHLMGDEIGKKGVNPGYSFAGRMKGLAELRGVIHALEVTAGD